MINKFPGSCGTCRRRVEAGAGQAIRLGAGWTTYHDHCAPVEMAPPRGAHRGWHDMPVVGFDVETTGDEPMDARIVSAALTYSDGTTTRWLINPGVPIPPRTTEIHGITDEMVRSAGRPPREALVELGTAIEKVIADGTPLVAFCAHYDVTTLHSELARHALPSLDWRRVVIIDPSILHQEVEPHRYGGRQLGDLCQYYEVNLGSAHDAASDARAAVEMAVSIAARHERIARMLPDDLHRAQITWYAAQKRKLQDYFDQQGRDETVSLEWPLETKRRR
ncbi:exonuclease domain-containing protein [Micromonospora sp. WMMD1128]|uniref:exonuclease domain-containing protein n=1 Tax=Micromonospora sp. WMMD1128 TaxID=3015150 RepID=UPI00248B65AB|nr:exonuclease domain-containing protein [Micromonospora sp. WMMD1128]WBB75277.1 exonuclease domain-containing protein [Micromonospora sp. WMMD1128]